MPNASTATRATSRADIERSGAGRRAMSSRSRGVASSSPSASASTMTGRMDVEAATDDRRGRGTTTTTTTTTTAPMTTTTAMTTMTTRRETRARRPRRHVSTRATGREEWDDAMMTTTNAGTPKTTRRALALALASTVTSMGVVVAPEPARAKFSIFDDDDDPFARNDASRVLDRRGDARETRGSGDDSKAVETRVETVEETSMGEVESTREVAKPSSPPPPPARVTESSTKVDTKQLLNNQRIKTYNNAPADFPAFIREGYDVSVVHGNDYVVREDGLIVKDYEVGEGESPKDNQECTFEYVAYNENGGTIDSTYRRGEPASTRLGINGMIPGFELGLKDMKPGGRRRIIVPPELGPPTGPATFFSAKQWEVFDIELLGVKSCSRSSFGMVSNVVCD